MKLESKIQLENIKIYVYCQYCFNIIYIFNSKQDIINIFKINKKTLKSCISLNIIYINFFIITNNLLNDNLLNNNKKSIINLIFILKEFHFKYPKYKIIIAQYIIGNFEFKKEFNSINELTIYLKGNRNIISKYININKLYRDKWLIYEKLNL